MIKELGTIGFYIKFNESASAAFKFLEVFSSSAASLSLFSASTDTSKTIALSSPSANFYLNGASATSLYDDEWQHVTFTFVPRLKTQSSNNFLVRFGNSTKSNFNIQNLYMTSHSMRSEEVAYIHSEFTGYGTNASVGYSSSVGISFLDKNEERHSSSGTGIVYLPYTGQNKFIGEISAVGSTSASKFLTQSLPFKFAYYDGYAVASGEKFLSLADNEIYEMQSTGLITTVSTNNGEYVRVLKGIEYEQTVFVKTSGSFVLSPFLSKIRYQSDNE